MLPKRFERRFGGIGRLFFLELLLEGSQRQVRASLVRRRFKVTSDCDCRRIEEHVPGLRFPGRVVCLPEQNPRSARDGDNQNSERVRHDCSDQTASRSISFSACQLDPRRSDRSAQIGNRLGKASDTSGASLPRFPSVSPWACAKADNTGSLARAAGLLRAAGPGP